MNPLEKRQLALFTLLMILFYTCILSWSYHSHQMWRQSVGWNDCSAQWMNEEICNWREVL